VVNALSGIHIDECLFILLFTFKGSTCITQFDKVLNLICSEKEKCKKRNDLPKECKSFLVFVTLK
jgi:hypothetical protein